MIDAAPRGTVDDLNQSYVDLDTTLAEAEPVVLVEGDAGGTD